MSSEAVKQDAPVSPRIITFYSCKGGTGRSMALANVAWILASNGYRVLMIDWDLEAPGLHRWYGPLLDDPELQHSPGVINFFHDFVEGSRIEELERQQVRLVVLCSQADIDRDTIEDALSVLRTDFSGLSVFRDGDILAGARWTDVWKEELENCDLALVFYGHSWFDGTMPEAWPLEKFALFLAARDDVTVIPVACRGVPFRMLPLQLLERSGLSLDTLFPNVRYPEGPDGFQLGRELSKRLTPLLDVEGILSSSATTSSRPDPEDPHKGQFGGLAKRNGTELTTKIADVRGAEDWWRITLVVTVEPNSGIEGSVTFHLHPTFSEPRITVPICSGRAELLVFAWDAFTAGAELDSGRRRLELDPGTLPDAPSVFRERWSDTSETESFIP